MGWLMLDSVNQPAAPWLLAPIQWCANPLTGIEIPSLKGNAPRSCPSPLHTCHTCPTALLQAVVGRCRITPAT